MIQDIFATKLGMTQAWTKAGRRLAITKVSLAELPVLGITTTLVVNQSSVTREAVPCTILEVGYGKKKLKNMTKPLKTRLEKSGFSFGVRAIKGIRVVDDKMNASTQTDIKVGDIITADQVLTVGDVVTVQGVSKGRGFAGGMKRHGFHGGPATHGQSDRSRAVGSIGSGTTPGRVWKGLRMPGHHGVESKTVSGLVVVHIDIENKEVWLSGPIPGSVMSQIKISKSGRTKAVELDLQASSLSATQQVETKEAPVEQVN